MHQYEKIQNGIDNKVLEKALERNGKDYRILELEGT